MRKDELPGTLPASFRFAAALVSAMLVSSLPMPVLSQDIHLVVVDVHEVAEGYRASKLIGNSVVNDQNERIGTIDGCGAFVRITTVRWSGASTSCTPSNRKMGLALRLRMRSNDHLTSADVSSLPLANLTPDRIVKV